MLVDEKEGAEILNQGGNLIIPTETVYGLAASIFHPNAIETIYRLKGRPSQNPLIVHASSLSEVKEFVEDLPPKFDLLADSFWPGPLTLILKAKQNLSPLITSGLPTVGIRIPNHPETLRLIELTGPLAAPSANLSGKPSSTRIEHLENDFGKAFPILRGSPPTCGLESTILGYIEGKWQLLRYGFLTKELIESVLEEWVEDSHLQICPGTRFKHYSPKATLLSGPQQEDAEAIIGYENRLYPPHLPFYSLGSDKDPLTIANRLFATLRQIDDDGRNRVWIDTHLPEKGLYKTILERLSKAMNKKAPLLS